MNKNIICGLITFTILFSGCSKSNVLIEEHFAKKPMATIKESSYTIDLNNLKKCPEVQTIILDSFHKEEMYLKSIEYITDENGRITNINRVIEPFKIGISREIEACINQKGKQKLLMINSKEIKQDLIEN